MKNEGILVRFRKGCVLALLLALIMGLAAFDGALAEWVSTDDVYFSPDLSVGDFVTFGQYPQTASGTDKTPIEWLVLENDGEVALLISRYALECKPYNDELEAVTWETSTLRSWLNDEFYNWAFTVAERSRIAEGVNAAGVNPYFHTDAGYETWDSLFLLSIEEANKYEAYLLMCVPTDYALARGVSTYGDCWADGRETCYWWLRSPGDLPHSVTGVDSDGSIGIYGCDANDTDCGVRPCVWVWLGDN